jgi:hypothetical protein
MKESNSRKKPWIEYVNNFIDSNTFVPVECYGRWNDIVKKAATQHVPLVALAPSASVAPSVIPEPGIGPGRDELIADLNDFNDKSVPRAKEMRASQVIAQWLKKVYIPDKRSVGAYFKKKDAPVVRQPVESDFMIPVNSSEHKEIVKRLTMAGSTRAEAEQVIAARKIAFKKATSLYKKTAAKSLRVGQRRSNGTRKLIVESQESNGY